MDKILIEKLITQAINCRQNSYSPYSKYQVGACLLTKDNHTFTGCNVENASYGATNCAERSALFSAVSNGYQEFKAIAIVADKINNNYCSPCGICLQVLSEFCSDDMVVILATNISDYTITTLGELLPHSFSLIK